MTDPIEVMATAIGACPAYDEVHANPGELTPQWIIEAHAVIAALDAAGYAIVPKEPTRPMVKAGGCEFISYDAPDRNAETIFAAMVEAGAVKP